MGYEDVLGAFHALIVEADAPRAVKTDAEGFLRARGLVGGELARMAALGERRLLLYRRLVRRGLEEGLLATLPRTLARLEGARDRYLASFLDAGLPRSPYVRDVGFELAAWAEPRWRDDPEVPRYLGDLARHELLAVDLGCAADLATTPERRLYPSGVEPELHRPLRFEATARLACYEHAVHLLPEDVADRTVPEARPTVLFAYRDDDYSPRYLELSPLAGEILRRLLEERATLERAVVEACAARGEPMGEAVLAGTAEVLADLAARGVLLGAETELD